MSSIVEIANRWVLPNTKLLELGGTEYAPPATANIKVISFLSSKVTVIDVSTPATKVVHVASFPLPLGHSLPMCDAILIHANVFDECGSIDNMIRIWRHCLHSVTQQGVVVAQVSEHIHLRHTMEAQLKDYRFKTMEFFTGKKYNTLVVRKIGAGKDTTQTDKPTVVKQVTNEPLLAITPEDEALLFNLDSLEDDTDCDYI